jgi:hypothetical protein
VGGGGASVGWQGEGGERSNPTNVGSRLANVGSRPMNIGSRLTNVGRRLTNAGSRLTNVGSRLANVGSGLTNVGSGLTNVGSGLTNVGSGLTNVGSRPANVCSRLTITAIDYTGTDNFSSRCAHTVGSRRLLLYHYIHLQQGGGYTEGPADFDNTSIDTSN